MTGPPQESKSSGLQVQGGPAAKREAKPSWLKSVNRVLHFLSLLELGATFGTCCAPGSTSDRHHPPWRHFKISEPMSVRMPVLHDVRVTTSLALYDSIRFQTPPRRMHAHVRVHGVLRAQQVARARAREIDLCISLSLSLAIYIYIYIYIYI